MNQKNRNENNTTLSNWIQFCYAYCNAYKKKQTNQSQYILLMRDKNDNLLDDITTIDIISKGCCDTDDITEKEDKLPNDNVIRE